MASEPPFNSEPGDLGEWECQCARCGSSIGWEDGYSFCLSSAEYCGGHPLPGREAVERHALEWFEVPNVG